MSGYAMLGVSDTDAAADFYDAVLGAVSWASHAQYGSSRSYSKDGVGKGFEILIGKPFNGNPASAGNGTMIGLYAPSREAVDAFHTAALAHGGTDEGAPGLRPHYGPNWYAAYVRDADGNKLAAVFRAGDF